MIRFRLPAIAGLFVSLAISAGAATYPENFTHDPAADGWQIFGETNLFQWDSTNHNLAVTWDSTKTNSYFFHPLDFAVTANDDFSVEFDLNLSDIMSGNEPGKTTPMELGFEFLDGAAATDPSFERGNYGAVPNIAGFDYYTDGYYFFGTVIPTAAATEPAFVSGTDSYDYLPKIVADYDNRLPLNRSAHVSFSYTASNQTALVIVTTNGVALGSLPPLVLNGPHGFTDPDYNFLVDTFCICSFSSHGDDYDSVLAHGTVANLVVTEPPPAQNLSCAFTNGTCGVSFDNHLNWLYTLQRTTDFISWQDVSAAVAGNGANLILSDNAAPPLGACYRVSAKRP